jgi:hypothetical protein
MEVISRYLMIILLMKTLMIITIIIIFRLHVEIMVTQDLHIEGTMVG